MIFFSEASLRYAINEYIYHYHEEGKHRGLNSRIIRPEFDTRNTADEIIHKERVGGLHSYYYRKAA